MSTMNKNLSIKNTVRAIAGTLLAVLFLVVLISAANRQHNKTISGVHINLNDENEYSFLETGDIEKMLLAQQNISLYKTSISQLDLRKMENIAQKHPWIRKAEIFVDNKNVLNINIIQREPAARIFNQDGSSYYIDSLGSQMPFRIGYAYPAPVFTNVPVFVTDSLNNALRAKINRISRTLNHDTFWSAQITQIELQSEQKFVLIPLAGNHKIILGDTDNLDNKLDNLLAFYKNIPDKVGWDKYETLDVRFSGQVIASPSIGWVAPPPPVESPVADTSAKEAVAAEPKRTEESQPVKTSTVVTRPSEVKKEPKENPATKTLVRNNPEKKTPVRKKETTDKKETDIKQPKYIYKGNNPGNN